ncbi:uncharacterized protein LOC128232458 [Mya arenaria]|uniref:uncharacterized protein LOC128232458 n=1 Tax=Mya arenaria TaxID=6604 RepID=UPI0022E4E145|nr:uncharacterized protein LOC128232458 [Mya arenaria]
MARTKFDVAVIGVFFSLCDSVLCYYCDNDKCLEDQFCCGENICCVSYKVWELWYFWLGILFCVFLLSLCGCFWRERQRAYWFHSPTQHPYRQLNPEDDLKYKDDYHAKKDRSPEFYGPSQPSWYSQGTASPSTVYSDNEQLYDTDTSRKPDY